MTKINWRPSPAEMRCWAWTLAPALGVMGALFHFLDWGIFAGGRGFARFLWAFGAVAFSTGITGTKIGLPAYWAWMAFVYAVSSVIGYTALTLVYLLVVTPLALAARLFGRDRLQLRSHCAATCWNRPEPVPRRNSERQF